jgi:hypothetical protein
MATRLRPQTPGPAAGFRPAAGQSVAAPNVAADAPMSHGDGPADRQAELLPLRMDAASLLDQSLHLKNRLASERRTPGARLVRRLHVWASVLYGVAARSAPSRPRKQDPDIRHCAAVLLKSGLFDSEYYLQHNPDVAAAGIDPVAHYLRIGAAELRNPGPYFSTRWYVQ